MPIRVQVDIRVKKDIRLAIDPVIVEKKVDLIGLLYQNSMNRSYSFAHYENENQWKIDVTLWGKYKIVIHVDEYLPV